MLDLLREILKSDAGSFGFVFALVCLIIYAVYKVTKFKTIIDTEHGTFGKRVDKIESNTDKIKEDLIIIRGHLFSKLPSSEAYTQSQSPISLTQKGKDVAKAIDIDSKVSENWNNIEQYIDNNLKNKNAYDIQQFCIEKATVDLSVFLSEKDINDIKLYAYNLGRTIESFGGIIGITIRDAYFRHKNINIDEVDKNDPNKK